MTKIVIPVCPTSNTLSMLEDILEKLSQEADLTTLLGIKSPNPTNIKIGVATNGVPTEFRGQQTDQQQALELKIQKQIINLAKEITAKTNIPVNTKQFTPPEKPEAAAIFTELDQDETRQNHMTQAFCTYILRNPPENLEELIQKLNFFIIENDMSIWVKDVDDADHEETEIVHLVPVNLTRKQIIELEKAANLPKATTLTQTCIPPSEGGRGKNPNHANNTYENKITENEEKIKCLDKIITMIKTDKKVEERTTQANIIQNMLGKIELILNQNKQYLQKAIKGLKEKKNIHECDSPRKKATMRLENELENGIEDGKYDMELLAHIFIKYTIIWRNGDHKKPIIEAFIGAASQGHHPTQEDTQQRPASCPPPQLHTLR